MLYHITVFALLAFDFCVIQHSQINACFDIRNKLCVQHGHLASFAHCITVIPGNKLNPESPSLKTTHNVHLFNDSSLSLFLELQKCCTAEQY